MDGFHNMQCQWCKEEINDEANVCPHCKRSTRKNTPIDTILQTLCVFAISFVAIVCPFIGIYLFL